MKRKYPMGAVLIALLTGIIIGVFVTNFIIVEDVMSDNAVLQERVANLTEDNNKHLQNWQQRAVRDAACDKIMLEWDGQL